MIVIMIVVFIIIFMLFYNCQKNNKEIKQLIEALEIKDNEMKKLIQRISLEKKMIFIFIIIIEKNHD
jgi:hypothetical protein